MWPAIREKPRKKLYFVGVLKVTDENSSILSRIRPLVRGTDPRIRIRITNMSLIHNIGQRAKVVFSFLYIFIFDLQYTGIYLFFYLL
jgi:hypothetical protein